MPSINILRIGTQGVDMKTHPLFIGAGKLHSAVNITFDEGRIRTRPGFRYTSLGVSGQFQGACLFTPSLGISSQSFADPLAGLVTVAGGQVHLNDAAHGVNPCPITIVCSADFTARGEVNVFGAENYLIIQNAKSDTHWWTGNGAAVQSPGMAGDLYWTDQPVPKVTFTPPAIEADIPECDRFPCEFDACTLELTAAEAVNATTATFTITNSGTTDAEITSFTATPPDGITFDPPELTILAGTDEEVTVTSATLDLAEFGLDVSAANSCGSAFLFNIPPVPPASDCELEIVTIAASTDYTAIIVLHNAGLSTITGIRVVPVGSEEWSFSPLQPSILGPGETVTLYIDSQLQENFIGYPFNVVTNCGTTIPGEIPEVITECLFYGSAIVGGVAAEGIQSGAFTLVNGGSVDVEVTGMDIGGYTLEEFGANVPGSGIVTGVPFTLLAGTSTTAGYYIVSGVSEGGSVAGETFLVENDCNEELELVITPA